MHKDPANIDPKFTILVKASGARIEGVQIEHVNEPEGGPASVVFLTKAGKRWKMHFPEFSFVFPAKAA